MKGILRGGFAGILATLTMSAVIFGSKKLGLMHEPPPKEITKRAAQESGVNPHAVPRPTFNLSWIAAHFGYGVGCGAVYTVIRGILPGGAVTSGTIYGLVVWAASYLGVMPALGLYPAPEDDSNSRAATMIAAHVVFGATLGKAANQD